ncbi:hypothetical protein [Kribbella sp. CA-293567]|uniref:hypothetical protein n=1 Tax=Kribbella sp. CA-293567 TaxID=3002436 RepID=UPI0022DE937D|nr:hypothetical protein [Kribbella sp. CA-293567]WBQ03404.1 hypothetical protein OX958_25940 [Kribbella sp. CA-293567]
MNAMDTQAGGELARQDLQQALRAGPFPAALHLAIEVSGMSLDQIQEWLAGRGVQLSATALNHWRRGRSRPERAESLRAVHLLEELLSVPADSLISLLGPRRGRGRWIGHVPGNLSLSTLFDDTRPLQALKEVGAPPCGTLSRLSTQVRIEIDSSRRTKSIQVRQLVRANVDGVSQCGVVYKADGPEPAIPPTLTGSKYCRVGRVSVDQKIGMVAGELILDRVLNAGDPALLKYSWNMSPRPMLLRYEHLFSSPRHEYVLQVQFDPRAVPARCLRYGRRTNAGDQVSQRELWIGASGTALIAELEVTPGIIGMCWEWPNTID